MKKLIINTLTAWLPLSVTVVFISGMLYLIIQQYIRLSANETPLQYAEDVKNKLENGMAVTEAFKGIPKTDMRTSLAPFVIICDNNGAAQAGTGTLNGGCPAPPTGVFTSAKQQGENRITWQPDHGLRFAAVILPFTLNNHEGFILGGRSLRETEKREHFAFTQAAAGIIITLIATFVVTWLMQFIKIRALNTT